MIQPQSKGFWLTPCRLRHHNTSSSVILSTPVAGSTKIEPAKFSVLYVNMVWKCNKIYCKPFKDLKLRSEVLPKTMEIVTNRLSEKLNSTIKTLAEQSVNNLREDLKQ